jgi:hypothetical protein
MKNLLAPLLLLILLTACFPKSYTKKQLKAQAVPMAFKMKGWTLEKIIDRRDSTEKYPTGNSCTFTFRFEPQGIMWAEFAEVKQRGTYTISNSQTCNLFVLHHKVVYSDDKQCDSMTFRLAFIFADTFSFRMEDQTLILTGSRYTMFLKTIIA